MSESKTPRFPRHLDRFHLPEPEWDRIARRCRVRMAERQRRPGADADRGAAGQEGSVLQPVPHHRTVLAYARGLKRTDVVSKDKLAPAKHTIPLAFTPDSQKPGSPAAISLSIDGKQVATGRVDEQVPMRCGTETIDVGTDCVSPVCDDYVHKGRYPFTGTIESVTFEFGDVKQPTGMERLAMSTKMD